MHGEALAAVYPSILHYSYKSAPKKFAEIGRIFDPSLEKVDDQAAAEKSCEALESYIHKIGMKLTLEDLKVPEKELDKLAETSMVLPDYQNHPRVATLAEIKELLEKSFS
jgi:alcohol dehydrogenase class IV